MKKKNNTKFLVDNLGKGAREAYIELNPHGFSCVNKVHKSKKTYNRNKKHID